MKTFIYALVAISLIANPLVALGLTDEELREIESTAGEIQTIAYEILECAYQAREMRAGRVTITQEQRQALIQEYQTLKQRLPGLYQELP